MKYLCTVTTAINKEILLGLLGTSQITPKVVHVENPLRKKPALSKFENEEDIFISEEQYDNAMNIFNNHNLSDSNICYVRKENVIYSEKDIQLLSLKWIIVFVIIITIITISLFFLK